MVKFVIIAFCLLVMSCGINGEQKVITNDSNQNVNISGDSYNYVIVRLEFIYQLIQLCDAFILDEDYESKAKANQARSKCVFDRLDNLNTTFPDFTSGVNSVCTKPPENLTEEELVSLTEICTKL